MGITLDSYDEFKSNKIISIQKAAQICDEQKSLEKTIGVCHGGFDLLHPGQVKHFESARELCDTLMVSITSDKYVSTRKGSGRPVFNEILRAYMIASLEFVDYVFISDFEKAVPMILQVKPSYYIKGPDFINKSTPGIMAEREAIKSVGGEMKYTTDSKLGTTEIIDYIKNKLDRKKLLVGIDRDGTLIEERDFLGRTEDHISLIQPKKEVLDFLIHLKTKYDATFVVVSNQAGVARGYFTTNTVESINNNINDILNKKGIIIESWKYCPDVEAAYAKMKTDISFNPEYVKEKTKRKPSPEMVFDALSDIKMKISDFSKILILGDREEDKGLAESLGGVFIDVKNKAYDDLIRESRNID